MRTEFPFRKPKHSGDDGEGCSSKVKLLAVLNCTVKYS